MAKCDCSGDDDKSEHGENVESANAEDDDAAAAAFPFLHICELLELRELWHLRGGRHKIALRLTECFCKCQGLSGSRDSVIRADLNRRL